MKVIHVITGLNTGGAEMMLYKLLSEFEKNENRHVVISLIDGGPVRHMIEALGVTVYSLGLQRRFNVLSAIREFLKIVREINPDIIQGWMYHGNLFSLLSKIFSRKAVKIVWNIRQSLTANNKEKKLTYLVIKANAWLSMMPAAILYNSVSSRDQHFRIGFSSNNSYVIPNGFDSEKFCPSSDAYSGLRESLSVKSNAFFIGLIARYHPMKDHKLFLEAASVLLKKYNNIYFILAGKGVDKNNRELKLKLDSLGIERSVYMLGGRSDIHRVAAALDIATSSSAWGEAFPNVIGESMSCGVPCVVTDVGDSANIVDDTGIVIPARNLQRLVEAWEDLINMDELKRRELGIRARLRIQECYSLRSVCQRYEVIYSSLLG